MSVSIFFYLQFFSLIQGIALIGITAVYTLHIEYGTVYLISQGRF